MPPLLFMNDFRDKAAAQGFTTIYNTMELRLRILTPQREFAIPVSIINGCYIVSPKAMRILTYT